ncbi:MAG TPA: SAF domain-containing protein [Roseiflexaceae bacterium]|nr:SAF domain-containing protein [Roseiflexaceae bacterium]
MTTTTQPLSQALSPRRIHGLVTLLFVGGMLVAIAAAIYGYSESRRSETVFVALRDIPYGRQIMAEDLATIELPLHRPSQVAGVVDPALVIGRWAAREIAAEDLVSRSMLLDAPPDQPVYPNGRRLGVDRVPLPFSTSSIGPLSDRDLVNIGFIADDTNLCGGADGAIGHTEYACRFLTGIPVLYVDGSTAYLELPPYQAHAFWALQAAGVQIWGERYGRGSAALPAVEALDAGSINTQRLLVP